MAQRQTIRWIALVVVLGGGLPLLADAQQNNGAGWLPPGGSVQVQTAQGIRYASGGIGLTGREAIRALSPQFNLQLMFAMQGSGNYVADAQVRILDARGAVLLDVAAHGPYFLAQLPVGRHTVEVNALGQSQRRTVQIGNTQSRLSFFWR